MRDYSATTDGDQQYSQFRERRERLIGLMDQETQVLAGMELGTLAEKVRRLRERVAAENFRVMVVGEFKRGKSTTINAMLGQKVLPAFADPTTAIINEVKWGETPRAVIYELKADNGIHRSFEVPVDQIERYVVIQDGGRTPNPYEKLELFWPLELCENGVEIIDSPGLNEDAERQQITMGYLPQVDAIVFVLSCTQLLSAEEMRTIQTIHDLNYEDLFFVCNFINHIEDPSDVERVKTRAFNGLTPLTRLGEHGIFFINAAGALRGRIAHDDAAVETSGMGPFERSLKTFLATQRGRIKIVRPARAAQAVVPEARDAAQRSEMMLHKDIHQLERDYQNAQEPLRQLEQERQQIGLRFSNFRQDLRLAVTDAASAFYRGLTDQIPGWAAAYKPSSTINFLTAMSEQKREAAVKDIADHLSQRVAVELRQWQTKTLEPMLQERFATGLVSQLEVRLRAFGEQLHQVQLDMVAGSDFAPSQEVKNTGNVSMLERVIAGGAGLLLVDPVSGVMGAVGGIKTMLSNLAVQLGVGIAAVLIAPPLVLPALLISGGVQGWLRGNQLNEQIKKKVGEEFARQLSDTREKMTREVVNAVDSKMDAVQKELDEELGTEIQGLREQVESVLVAKQRGQERVDEMIQALQPLRATLDTLDQQFGQLVELYALNL